MSADLGIGAVTFEDVARNAGPQVRSEIDATLTLPATELALRYIAARRYLRAIATQYAQDSLDPNVTMTSAMGALILGATLEVK